MDEEKKTEQQVPPPDGGVFTFSYRPPASPANNPGNQKEHDSKFGAWFGAWREDIATLTQVALVIAAIVVGCIYNSQLTEMRKQVEQMRTQLKLTYRARIEFGEPPRKLVEVDAPHTPSGKQLEWKITYTNFGRGMATDIWIVPTAVSGPTLYAPVHQGDAQSYVRKETTHRPVGPGQERTYSHRFSSSLGRAQSAYSIVQVVIYYRDEFGDVHETSICTGYKGTGLSFCPDGNYNT